MSCDGESATTELTAGFLIDDSNFSMDDINHLSSLIQEMSDFRE